MEATGSPRSGLTDQARLLAAAVDGSTDLIAVADLDGTVRFRNAATVETLGEGAEGRGGHVRDYYDDETWAFIADEVMPAVRASGHWQGEIRVRHLETGEAVQVDMNVFRVDDPDTGEPLGIATIQRDVTDRVRERERHHVQRLRGLARAAVAINSPLDVEQILEEVRREVAALIDVGHVSIRLGHGGPGEREAGGRSDVPVVETDGAPVIHRDDGALTARMITHGGGELGTIVLSEGRGRSFTEQDESILAQLAQMASVAIEKAHLYEAGAQQEAIRYREEMMAAVSHDMQTPLAAILGLADMLDESHDDISASERTEIYETLARQAHNLHLQVQRFLDYSILEADRDLMVHHRSIDVERVIERVVSLFQHQREIIVGVASGLPPAAGDPERLEQVLSNLVSNAIKYSDDPVRVVARRQAGRIVVDVVDEGRGMDDETLTNLFRKFQRGANVEGTPGTGLGLYVSRALVEAQGGTLTVSSNPGIGSRFRISLPQGSGDR